MSIYQEMEDTMVREQREKWLAEMKDAQLAEAEIAVWTDKSSGLDMVAEQQGGNISTATHKRPKT